MASARFDPGGHQLRRQQLALTPTVLTEALQGIVSADDLAHPWPSHPQRAPLWKAAGQRRYVHRSSVHYGDHPSQVLDVWRSQEHPGAPAPVLVYIPGGAWVFGSRTLQGHALMAHLVRRGWVCLSLEYRTSPQHRWPRQMTDVKAAIAWARANVADFGGDPEFIVAAGCSAGGHLATLAGLTANDPQWQAELPADADTSVDAVVSLYGLYDWQDRSTVQRARFMEFLERVVVKRSQVRHPEVFDAASPVDRIHEAAPPFLVVHGSRDSLIPVGEARAFVDKLRSVSAATVGYVELPGVGHGFDLVDGARTRRSCRRHRTIPPSDPPGSIGCRSRRGHLTPGAMAFDSYDTQSSTRPAHRREIVFSRSSRLRRVLTSSVSIAPIVKRATSST